MPDKTAIDCDTADAWGKVYAGPSHPTFVEPVAPAEFLKECEEIASAGVAATAAPHADAVAALRSRLLDVKGMLSLPPSRPLIKGVLELESTAQLAAAPGAGKSWVALDMSLAVGLGTEWLGRRVNQGTVMYLVAEGATGMGKRLRAALQDQGLTDAPIHFLPLAVQMLDPENWPAFIELCRELGAVLIVLDTQARVTIGVDENNNTDMGRVTAAADALKEATGACVLTIHHTGHLRPEQTDSPDKIRGRGASSVAATLDTGLTLSKRSDGVMQLFVARQKDARDGYVLSNFTLEDVVLAGQFDADGDPVTSAVLRPAEFVPGSDKAPAKGSESEVQRYAEELIRSGILIEGLSYRNLVERADDVSVSGFSKNDKSKRAIVKEILLRASAPDWSRDVR